MTDHAETTDDAEDEMRDLCARLFQPATRTTQTSATTDPAKPAGANTVPREGSNPTAAVTDDATNIRFVRRLFGYDENTITMHRSDRPDGRDH